MLDPPCVTFRRVAVSLQGPGQSPVLPFACCVRSLQPPPPGDAELWSKTLRGGGGAQGLKEYAGWYFRVNIPGHLLRRRGGGGGQPDHKAMPCTRGTTTHLQSTRKQRVSLENGMCLGHRVGPAHPCAWLLDWGGGGLRPNYVEWIVM